MSEARFFARSASDRTQDWPFWFVADRQKGGVNVTGKVLEKVTGERSHGAVLASRSVALWLADRANEEPQ